MRMRIYCKFAVKNKINTQINVKTVFTDNH